MLARGQCKVLRTRPGVNPIWWPRPACINQTLHPSLPCSSPSAGARGGAHARGGALVRLHLNVHLVSRVCADVDIGAVAAGAGGAAGGDCWGEGGAGG